MPGPVEELADLIDEARRQRIPLTCDGPEWQGVDRATAERVAEELYRRWGAQGSAFWKLGAVDSATQQRLGLDGPVCAPLVPDRVVVSATRVEIDSVDFLHAKFEGEVGIHVSESLAPVVCVEIADSRFEGWKLPSYGVVADGCLQGMMLFGVVGAATDSVHIDVTHDGHVVASGDQDWSGAAARLSVLPPDAGATYVATGAVTPLLDVTPGEWTFDFGTLGCITVVVR